ncbi:MAG: radical SAM protein [Candidatus Methanoperedens sp.]|uniref:B12-binding domain-containing radical SAM protein n=1 Tax=Candidatus Methanoperedens sp. BLZ2 TaxID=2035255 RepID=UPI000BE481BC|nr:radical SAM protein [Candidatus Methanoperedens sp. BLZ2]KAB2947085.1 MAG: B12-binding domain-containing radical SAM protein [Candidatus Methanoperedens sp.]MBZ0174181.1 B12-binding domain-containing radical SAM protein [Candidatus Methanoperedens nitroreducens]MCX9077701.1 radical SAM protein [Candidatus Methanoperedens sp.]
MSSRTDVLLIYPYFHREPGWRKLWLFPPLGLGYLASVLRESGISVSILDGTFMLPEELIKRAQELSPGVVGIYCMVTMRDNALKVARALGNRPDKPLLVAGGPFPTSEPGKFLEDFDVVVLREGEQTMLELVKRHLAGKELAGIKGIALMDDSGIMKMDLREYIENIDSIPHPARDLFENRKYMKYWEKKFGYSCTPVITTRGCPYNCDYCARPVFGNHYRERSFQDVIGEVEEVLELGYGRVWFSDDVFTLNKERIMKLCNEIKRRRLVFTWDCLCRVDNVDFELFKNMREAGCARVLFGIESGDNGVLSMLNKRFTVTEAQNAVMMAKKAGIEVGTFFMVGYPGETEETILRTIRFSTRLPSDYLSYTLPYPLPGTGLYKKLEDRLTRDEWKMAGHNLLMFRGDFSQVKLRFAIFKGIVQHKLRKNGYARLADGFEAVTDNMFKMLR